MLLYKPGNNTSRQTSIQTHKYLTRISSVASMTERTLLMIASFKKEAEIGRKSVQPTEAPETAKSWGCCSSTPSSSTGSRESEDPTRQWQKVANHQRVAQSKTAVNHAPNNFQHPYHTTFCRSLQKQKLIPRLTKKRNEENATRRTLASQAINEERIPHRRSTKSEEAAYLREPGSR